MTTRNKVLTTIGIVLFLVLAVYLLGFATTEPSKAAGRADIDTNALDYNPVEIVPPAIRDEQAKIAASPTLQKKGCATAYVEGKIETSVLRWDVMNAAIWQKFCWESGQITYVSDLEKRMDVTTWGEAHFWREDGWRDGPNGYTDWGGKNKGGHFVNKTAKFKSCITPGIGGCLTDGSASIRLSILEHAGGAFYTSVGK